MSQMHDFLGQARKGGVNVLQHQLQHLMNVSQDKLSRDRDPDLCACLRKAVLVNNILRRSNSLQLSAVAESEDEDAMAICSPLPVAHSKSPLYRTVACDAETDDEDEDTVVPDLLNYKQQQQQQQQQQQGGMMIDEMMESSTVLVSSTAPKLEISPPPSPDSLEDASSEEEHMARAMYAAEVVRRTSLVRKQCSSGTSTSTSSNGGLCCSTESSTAEMLGDMQLATGAPSPKRVRLSFDFVH